MRRPRAGIAALVTVLATIVPIAHHAQAAIEPDSIIMDVYDYPDSDGLLDAIDYGAGAVYELNSGGEISRRTGDTAALIAGGGDSTADGIAATAAKIDTYDFVVAPDGTIYFADQTLLTVRKISPDGIITTVAGNGTGTASGDGGPALNAGMTPESVTIDTAGNLLIADGGFAFMGGDEPNPGNNRLRRVDPGGTITTLTTFDPTEHEWTTPVKVRVDDSGNAYVLLVQPAGGIGAGGPMVKVTPSGTKTFVGDRFYRRDFDVAPDGTVFFGSTIYFQGELFTVDPDGTVTTLNETSGLSSEVDYSPMPVSDATVWPLALALDPQGNLYLIDAYDGRLRVVVNDDPLPAAESVQPSRILDTRPGAEQTGYTGDKPGVGQTVTIQVAGKGGVPEQGAAAVTMNIVITEASDAGFVTVWPSGQARPLASSLNAKGPGDTVANLVTVPVGADGKVNLFTQSGGHLLADVSGWLPAGTYVPKTPTRILDTRPGAEQVGYTGDKPAPTSTVDLQVTGVAGVPSGIAAVTLNVTATEATAPGFVTIWPEGQTRPNASSLNLDAVGATAPNQVTVPVGATGKVSLYTQSGTHLIADIVGYYVESDGFTPLAPARILDTRPGAEQKGYSGDKPGAGHTVAVKVAGQGGVPETGPGSVILNVTATEATAPGFVSAWPAGTERPNASILNLTYAGQTRPNAVVVPIGADGTVNLFTQSGTHLIVDVSGWFPG